MALHHWARSESGFWLIGILIIVAIIALVGGGGLYLRETKQQKTVQQMGIEKLKEAEALKQKIEEQEKQAQEMVKENPQSAVSTIDVSNWKTYRNEEYGFEVKYPAFWEDEPNVPLISVRLSVVYLKDEAQCEHGIGCSYPIQFFARGISRADLLPPSRDATMNFEQYAEMYKNEALIPRAEIKTQKVSIDRHDAVKFVAISYKDSPDSTFVPQVTVIVDYSPEEVIILEWRTFRDSKTEISRLADDISSTFKFTK